MVSTSSSSSGAAGVVRFAGLAFRGATRSAIQNRKERFAAIITVNADFIVTAHENGRFARIIEENYATFDGQVPYALARWFGRPKGCAIEKLSGSELVPALLEEAAANQKRVFMLGAAPASNAAAVAIARERYQVEAAGFSPPVEPYPFTQQWRSASLAAIKAFRPHYVLVALGAPKQEFWIDDERHHLQESGVELCIGCGGSLDFLSGRIQRAPRWMQISGLEGVFRLLAEPKWFRVKRLLRSVLVFRYVFK